MRLKEVFLTFFVLLALIISVSAVSSNTPIVEVRPTGISFATILGDATNVTALNSDNGSVNYLKWPSQKLGVTLLLSVMSVSSAENASPHLTIVKGDNPPAFRSGLGDLNLSTSEEAAYVIGPLESARFINKTGYLNVYGTNITEAYIFAMETRRQ